jgi:hypothetical protein
MESRPSQQFLIQRMEIGDFLSFRELVIACPKPRYLRVTRAIAIKVESIFPNDISVKTEHDIEDWDVFESVPLRPIENFNFPQKSEDLIPLSADLNLDLRKAYDYIPLEASEYWDFIFEVQLPNP